MTSYSFADVVVVPFPLIFTLEQSKVLMHLGRLKQDDISRLETLLWQIIGNPAHQLE